MKINLLQTAKRSKYVLMVSAAALMGAVMMSTNCMAMMSSDAAKAEEGGSSVVENHSDVYDTEVTDKTVEECRDSIPAVKKSSDAPTVKAHGDTQVAEKSESVEKKVSKDQAIEDVNYVLRFINEHHVAAVEKIPDEVLKQAELEIAKLGDEVTIIDEWRIVSRILSKLHDGHTRTWTPDFLSKRKLPLATEYRDGKFVCADGELVGYEIEAINGISVSDLYKIFQEHYSYEIEEWTEYNFFEDPADFIPEWKLALCGFDTTNPIEVSLRKGKDRKALKLDLIEIQATEKEPWISYDFDVENSIGYYKLDECIISDILDDDTHCENMEEAIQFLTKDKYVKSLIDFFSGVKKNGIKNIVIDLRKNKGGNNGVIRLFLDFLLKVDRYRDCYAERREKDKVVSFPSEMKVLTPQEIEARKYLPLFDGKIYILTSHCTFSSAKDFAVLFSDNNLATIVGEVPGNSVTQFGNGTDWVFTPNLGVEFRTTYMNFERPDPTKDKDRLVPNVEVSARDALAKVYELVEVEKNKNKF